MHPNSISAYASLNLSQRERAVLEVFLQSCIPLTDRQVMARLGKADPNYVRPRVTSLISRGILREVGAVKCVVTGKTVRLCEVAE